MTARSSIDKVAQVTNPARSPKGTPGRTPKTSIGDTERHLGTPLVDSAAVEAKKRKTRIDGISARVGVVAHDVPAAPPPPPEGK